MSTIRSAITLHPSVDCRPARCDHGPDHEDSRS
jgi:hypothetical protein